MATFTLKRSVVLADRTISEIAVPGIDDLALDDVIALSELDGGDLRKLAGKLAEIIDVEKELLGKMSFGDVQRLIAQVVSPLQEAPGAMPSASRPKSRRSSQPT